MLQSITKDQSWNELAYFLEKGSKSQFPHLFLALDLDTDLESDGAGDGGAVRPLLEVVPHVHLPGQGPHLDDRLPEEVVALPRQLLPQPRLQVIVLVPDPDLDAVTRVVALAETVVGEYTQ